MKLKKVFVFMLMITFVISNIGLTSNAVTGNSMPSISFEEGEDLSIVSAEDGVTTQYVTDGVTHGSRAMSVNVGALDAEYNGVIFQASTSWDFGEDCTLVADIKNPSSSNMQIRVDVTDINGETRTNYFPVNAYTSRKIGASNFGPLAADFTRTEGWWGAENGLDTSNIVSVRIYIWEEGVVYTNTFIVDKVAVSSPTTSTFEKLSFETEIPSFLYETSTTAEIVTQGATDGTKALKVNFTTGGFPSIRLLPDEPFDWGSGTCLSFDVTNPSNESKTVHIKVVDSSGNETVGRTTIAANSTKSVYMPFNTRALYLGMRFYPPTDGRYRTAYAWGAKSIDTTSIVECSFFLYTPPTAASLIFDNIQVEPDPTLSPTYLDGIIDQFGQYTGKDWTTKIHSANDLIASKNAELQDLAAGNPNLPNTSKYGGWLDGPKLAETGHFRTEKYNGKWALVDPEGYLFFATGVDILRFADMETWIEGRENMFDPVPSHDGSLADHYRYCNSAAVPPLGLMEGWVYNHYTANLEQKYGTNYAEEWRDMTLERMKNWGFSTLGNWSEPSLFWGKGDQAGIAYVADTWIRGSFAVIDDGQSPGLLVPDAFDPSFKSAARSAVTSLIGSNAQNDPWCVGVYINNEISWGNSLADKYSIIKAVLQKDASGSYAKRAFITALQEKYSNSITALNNAWGTTIGSWANLEASYTVPSPLSAGLESDLSMMLKMLATEYYKTVDEEFDTIMPDKLNLGSRLAEWGCSDEVQEGCAPYVDVISYNVYKHSIETEDWIIADQLDKPCIIGEFHFGADDERMFSPGLIAAETQQERGQMYQNYIRDLLESPYFVGAHWFQYVDQPNTGRSWDGENYNAGFVDIADVPYDILVNAAKEIHSRVYDIKYGTNEEVFVIMNQSTAQIDVNNNSTLQLAATVTPDTISNRNVNWSSSNPSAATVNSNGLVTAVGNGTTTITATSQYDSRASDTCTVTVINVEGIDVTLNQNTAQIDASTSTTLQLTATVTPDSTSNKNVTWSSSTTSVATVDNNGLIIAVSNGTTTITATSEADSSASDSCTVTVTGFTTQPVNMTKISFEESENLEFMSTYNQAAIQFTTQGVIDGTRALQVNVGTLDANYGGAQFNTVDPMDWGNNAIFKAYLTNPNNQDIQIRIDIKDTSNNTRINYFSVGANTSRTITIDNLGPVAGNYSGADGWWGAENGLNQSNIDLFQIYLWEERPNLTANTFIVDNIETSSGVVEEIEVTLNQNTAQINANTSTTFQLTAVVTPDTTSNNNIIWSSSNTSVATVDNNGLVTALSNGTAIITATSEADSSASDTCVVTVTGFTTQPVDMTKISFEESENLEFMSAYNQATTQFTTQGVSDGTRALSVNVGTLDSTYSGVKFEGEMPSDWDNNAELKAYLTNPHNQDIQIRIDITDTSNNTRVNYFTLSANTSRTITINNLGPQAGNFSGTDGWWGAENGLDLSNIDSFQIYLWEERPNLTANTFIVDNIEIIGLSNNFAVSFESDENLDFVSTYNQATMAFTTQGVSDGTRALEVNVGTLDATYSGVKFDETAPLNWGNSAVFEAYLTNLNNEDIQIRIDITDTSNNTRINYFSLGSNASRTITVDNLGPQAGNFSGTDGWWGAENGLDLSNIDSFQIYLWEERPNLTANTFIVDSINVLSN